MARVSLDRVSKIYDGGVKAVDEVVLEVADGELVCFVGPSGCGKSTLLRMIAGLEDVGGGDIYIGERRVNGVSPSKRDVAMVFQDYALYPHMTVRKNLAYGLKLRKVPADETAQRVDHAARMLGIEPLLERKPRALSGGQRQRVALGRAMVREPQVFLMDEPLSNLDAKLRVEMRAEIRKLHDRVQGTTIYVTHDQVEAMTMADRIVALRDGTVQQVGPPDDLYSRPANVFVAGFLGSPPINLLHARVELDGDDTVLAAFAPADVRLVLPHGERSMELRGRAGETVIVGVRPEDLSVRRRSGDAPRANGGRARVEVIESTGSETYHYLDPRPPGAPAEPAETAGASGQPAPSRLLTAKGERGERVERGDEVLFTIDPVQVHVFSVDTGVTVA
jgi:multiple sugar transport system ATP-binding protein